MSLKDMLFGKQAAREPASPVAPVATTAGAPASADAPAAEAATPDATPTPATPATPATSPPAAAPASKPPPTLLSSLNQQLVQGPGGLPPSTDALNDQIVQAVQISNAETAAYAASQIAVAPNMMITQASGLVAQSAAAYFDGASKMALASKSVLLKNMTEKFAKEDLKGAAEDALGVLLTDLLMGTAAAVAAAAGAIEAESAHFALDKIDQSIDKYHNLLDRKG
ncbi:hypothetical protein [Chitinolyticbacter albus]|uniref:hypothetical protein n=1 Tax=Chitinolyticbacter albus TaxID=2961951 RepID=UPI00210F2184|nr:hypothetical protein [Chitinolyticbacter albus]